MAKKKDMINRIAEKTGLTKKSIKQMLEAFKELIYEVVEEEERLYFKELFVVKTVKVKGRKRYIASKDEMVYEEEHKKVKIIPSKNLMDVIKDK